MEWNIMHYSLNRQKIVTGNIFSHSSFAADVRKLLRKSGTKEILENELRMSAMYYFWCRSEWELLIEKSADNHIYLLPWVGSSDPEKDKTDVTDNKDFDWNGFIGYILQGCSNYGGIKFDVYSQLRFVWDNFVDYCWDFRCKRKSGAKERK